MAETGRSNFCENCGTPLQAGDKFCGTCGAAVLPPPPQVEQVIPQQVAASEGTTYRSARSRRTLINGAVFSVMALLLVVGVVLLVFNNGLGLLSGSNQRPQAAVPETTDVERSEPSSSPDPAFDSLLPTLMERTNAPIMLPAQLPETMDFAIFDSVGDSQTNYRIVFPFGPTGSESVSTAETLGALEAYPEGEDVANQFFDAEEIEEVNLSDGTEATLRYMAPSGQAGSQGPYWEGKFDRDGYTYRLTVIKPNEVSEQEVRQVLSSMVFVQDTSDSLAEESPDSDGEINSDPDDVVTDEINADIDEITSPEQDSDIPSEDAIESFVFEYYDAVARKDWETTYALLADDSQSEFTEDEWIESQEVRESTDGEFSSLESSEIAALDGVGAIVTLYFSDGTSGSTTLNYSVDSQEWRRYLTDEDISYLNDLLSQDEDDDAPDTLVDTSSVEQFVYDYYEAVQAEDWAATYSLLSYTSREEFTESEWIEKQQTRQATSGPPASVSEVSVSVPADFAVNPTFTATVSFEDGTSADILVVDSHSQDGLQRILTDEEIEYLEGL